MEHVSANPARGGISFLLFAHAGFAGAFLLSLSFSGALWRHLVRTVNAVFAAADAPGPNIISVNPLDAFTTLRLSIPLSVAAVLATPWVLYRFWRLVEKQLGDERDWTRKLLLSGAVVSLAGALLGYVIADRAMWAVLGGMAEFKVASLTARSVADPFLEHLLGTVAALEIGVVLVFLLLHRLHRAQPRPEETVPAREALAVKSVQYVSAFWGVLALIGAVVGITANIQFGVCGILIGVVGWRMARASGRKWVSFSAVSLSALSVVLGLRTLIEVYGKALAP